MDMNGSVAHNSETDSMKEMLNLFNHKFREIYGIQSTWRVYNEQLRKQIIISIQSILLPTYENFICMFHNIVGTNADEYIEYGMSNIQDQLNLMFLLEEVDCVK
jgi:ABC-type tungstate transport system permease subunit